jgi:hypothetical protein
MEMVRQEKQVKVSVGDKVTDLSGAQKGIIIRLGTYGETVQVKWNNRQQQMVFVNEIKKDDS